MPSTFTLSSGIEKPGSGEQSGTWGTTVNTNMDIIDRSMNGIFELGLTGTTSNLQTTDGTLSEGMYRFIKLTGSLSAAHTITVLPADAQKIYYFKNETTDGGSGLQDVTIQQGAGTFVVPNGATKAVYMDGNGTVDEIVFGTSFTTTNTGTGYGAINYSAGILDYSVVTDANIRGAISGTGDISFNQSTGVISYTGSGGTVNNSTINISTGNGISGGSSFTLNQSTGSTISLTVGAGNGLSQSSTGLLMSGSYSGSFSATQNITAYASDDRLKDYHGTIPDALEKLSKINGYYYTLNDVALNDLEFDDLGMEVGVSAQEMEAVLPEVVRSAPVNEYKGTDYKTVQYERIVSLLIEAVKELKGQVEEMQDAIANRPDIS